MVPILLIREQAAGKAVLKLQIKMVWPFLKQTVKNGILHFAGKKGMVLFLIQKAMLKM